MFIYYICIKRAQSYEDFSDYANFSDDFCYNVWWFRKK